MSNRAIQLMCRNPHHVPVLTKCNSQLLQTYRLKGWHNSDCYDEDIRITGFRQKRFTALLCYMPCMYKYMCVCFIVTARGTPSRLIVWLLSTFSSLVTITLLGDGICSILSARKLNRTVFFAIVSQEVAPV